MGERKSRIRDLGCATHVTVARVAVQWLGVAEVAEVAVLRWLRWRWLGVAGGVAGVAEAVVADRVRGRV